MLFAFKSRKNFNYKTLKNLIGQIKKKIVQKMYEK